MESFDVVLGITMYVIPASLILGAIFKKLDSRLGRVALTLIFLVLTGFPYLLYSTLGENPGRAARLAVQSLFTPTQVERISCPNEIELVLKKDVVLAHGNRLELGTESRLVGEYSIEIYHKGELLDLDPPVLSKNPLVMGANYGYKINDYADMGDIYDPATNVLKTGLSPITIILNSDQVSKNGLYAIAKCVAENEEVVFQYAAHYLYESPNVKQFKIRGVYAVPTVGETRQTFFCADGAIARIEERGSGFITSTRGNAQIVVRQDGTVTPSYFAIDSGAAAIAEQILPTCKSANGERIGDFYRKIAERIDSL